MGSGRAKRDKGLKMTKDFLKHLFTVLSKGKAIDAIVETYKAELKNKEEKHGDELQALLNDMGRAISKLSGELKAKDARIEELEAMVEKMKCCENCNFYPPQKCSFNTQQDSKK